MERVEKETDVWVPNVEECEVIDILSNLGDYLMVSKYVGSTVDRAEIMHDNSVVPPRVGSYCELRTSGVLPKISSPSWKPKSFTPSQPKKVWNVSNPYGGAVGDGKMYVSMLRKPFVRPSVPASTETEIGINLQDHEGWERLDFLEEYTENG